jgi:sensor histidine kinase regulating citrate/malate metabolism
VADVRNKKFRISLKIKLSLLITLLIVLSVGLVGDYLLDEATKSLRYEMTKRGLTIANNLAASARNALVTHDDLTLSLLVRDALKDEDVAYVVFADDDGKVVAHGDLNFVGRKLDRPKELKPLANQLLVQNYDDAKGGEVRFRRTAGV